MKKTPGITFFPEEKHCELRGESSILDVALNNKISLSCSCGGMASCGTCRIIVLEGLERLEERNELEKDMADSRNFRKEERLACQTTPVPGLKVEIPEDR